MYKKTNVVSMGETVSSHDSFLNSHLGLSRSLRLNENQPLNFEAATKVIHTKYSKHRPSTVAHTFECVCSKIDHGLNHGLYILPLKLIN